MRFIGWLCRTYSYLFHIASAVFLLGIGCNALLRHQPVYLTMLPFEEDTLLRGTFELGFGGLLAVYFSAARWWKPALPLWAAGTVVALVKGFFFSSFVFRTQEELNEALWYLGAATLAFLGALWILKPRRGRLYS